MPHSLALTSLAQFHLFHPGDIICKRKIGSWPDEGTPLGEEWEGIFLEKIPCDVWQDLRHERPVLVRKFAEEPGIVRAPLHCTHEAHCLIVNPYRSATLRSMSTRCWKTCKPLSGHPHASSGWC